jgi:Zn-dependent peptidase ImmA (M78 family)/transcriptional regulator with XRE-family HTH domain
MVDVPVNKDVLSWARMERKLAPADAARLAKIPLNDLTAYEAGRKQPTLGVLRKLASAYELPLATLLMPEPLPDTTRPKINDYRTLEGRDPSLSHAGQLALEEIDEQLIAFADIRDMDPALVPVPTLAQYRLTDDPAKAGEAERKKANIPAAAQMRWATDREAFLRWRQWIEGQGVFVYQLKMDIRDCRGFSVWDDRQVAAIVVNAAETEYKYKTFTLLHEFCHLLLRMAGLSDERRNNRVERFCNQFAAYFLMPSAEFKRAAESVNEGATLWTEAQVGRLSNLFHLSKSSITYHLEDVGVVSRGYFDALRAELSRRRRSAGGGRATHIERYANRLGARPVETVTRALETGKLSKLDAFEILDVRPDYFNALRREIDRRKAEFGAGG